MPDWLDGIEHRARRYMMAAPSTAHVHTMLKDINGLIVTVQRLGQEIAWMRTVNPEKDAAKINRHVDSLSKSVANTTWLDDIEKRTDELIVKTLLDRMLVRDIGRLVPEMRRAIEMASEELQRYADGSD